MQSSLCNLRTFTILQERF